MPILHAPLTSAVFEFADGLLLGKLLQFPGASAVHRNEVRLGDELRVQAEKLSDRLDLLEFHRRQLAAEVRCEPVAISIDPKREDKSWRSPLELIAHAFLWENNDRYYASLPLLDICVVGESEEQLLERVRSQAHFVLARNQRVTLNSLLLLPQPTRGFAEQYEWSMNVKTPKELHRLANKTETVSVLKDIADNLGIQNLDPIVGRNSIVREMAELLNAKRPTSILLIGESGVGKTAIVHQLVRNRDKLALKFRQYWQTSGSRIVAGMCGFGAWQERCEALCTEVRENEAMLHLGNLFELMEVGQHEASQQGIGDYLRPFIESGKLPSVAECTPQQADEIQRRNPRMLDAFEQIQVSQTSRDDTREILRQLASKTWGWKATIPDEAIETSLQLHDRFARYSARPGRVARFFTYLLEDRRREKVSKTKGKATLIDASKTESQDLTLNAETTIESFSRQTGLPRPMLDDSVPLDLEAAEAWFNDRVMGQQQAVSHVVDSLANVKASLTRPGRPIASLLMIGPTGVGKTELAKSLTEFLYQNADRMTRIDMSEYADPLAAERLAGSSWQEEGLLTSRVREQPFGVVLLDEFEKAHSSVFDLLLQILGEGRLSDSVGRVADFSTSVVIMTSNLGAESASKTDFGFQSADESQAQKQRLADHYLKEVQKFLRPEIYNRIDSIIPFAPLARETVGRIVKQQLDALSLRIAERADDTSTEFDSSVLELIAKKGYEPTLGARPIRRQIERLVTSPVASTLNELQTKHGGVLQVNTVGEQVRVKLRSSQSQDALVANRELQFATLAQATMEIRRRAQKLSSNDVVEDMRNERSRQLRLKARLEKRKKEPTQHMLRKIDQLERELSDIESFVEKSIAFEEETLLAHYKERGEAAANDTTELELRIEMARELSKESREHVFHLFGKSHRQSNASLFVFANQGGFMEELATAYETLFGKWKMSCAKFEVFVRRENQNRLPDGAFALASPADREALSKSKDPHDLKDHDSIEFFAISTNHAEAKEHRANRKGIGYLLNHRLAAARLLPEEGFHHRIRRGVAEKVRIILSPTPANEFEPPSFKQFREDTNSVKPRRTFQYDKMLATDKLMETEIKMRRDDPLSAVVEQFVDRSFEQEAERWFGKMEMPRAVEELLFGKRKK